MINYGAQSVNNVILIFFAQNIGSAASESLSDFQANVLAKELLSWCVFVARR